MKRLSNEQTSDGFRASTQEAKRQLCAGDVLGGHSLDDFTAILGPLIRGVVQEEVKRCVSLFLHQSPRSSLNQSEILRWKLHFVNKLPSFIYTGTKLELESNELLEICIVDANSNTKITDGPLSSIKIEIVTLDGEFGKDGDENWTEAEFNNQIVRERENKRPLVIGEVIITLRNGSSFVGDISFTDNSRWTKSGKFRLGARIVQNVSPQVRIREARSEAFAVKDRRGESYKKHYPPSLGDEVWRLDKIRKSGIFHTRLASEGIHSLQNFLQLYVTNPSLLREVLGSRISNMTWDTIIKHATTCVIDDSNLYAYYRIEQGFVLFFNSIYKVVGVSFDGQSYHSTSSLVPSVMDFVENIKQQAYKNISQIVLIGDQSINDPSRNLLDQQVNPSSVPCISLLYSDITSTQQDQWETQQDINQSSLQFNTNEHGNSSVAGETWPGDFLQTWNQGQDGLFLCASNCSRTGKQNAAWCTILAALKWKFLVRRKVAERMTQFLCELSP